VCGGIAAEPLAVTVLLGIGVDELSVPVPAIAAIKALVRRLSLRPLPGSGARGGGLGHRRVRFARGSRSSRQLKRLGGELCSKMHS